MNETQINWTDVTWNPASGCSKVSAGCKYCYAENLAENKRGTLAFPRGFELTIRPHKLDEPRRLKRPSLVFVNSMSDLFWEEIPDDYRDRVIDAMRAAPQHRYQVLTKRPENARRYFERRAVPDCMWMGTTIEHALTVGRADILRDIDAKVRFISAEPLIGQLDGINLSGIHWLIGGGESGCHLADADICQRRGMVRRGDRRAGEPGWVVRKDREGWARHLRDACAGAGTAFWWKQWGGVRPESGGRLVDGVTHDGMPSFPGAMPPGHQVRVIAPKGADKLRLPLHAAPRTMAAE